MTDTHLFKPKLLTTLVGYTRTQFAKDIFAGVMVGIVALPLAIAFAIASGASPEKGIVTAVIAGIAIALFGGSRVQIGGPTGAFIVIVLGIIQDYGYSNLLIATLMAGIILVVMGLCRLGDWIRFVPTTVVVGFTSGIALVIFTSQLRDFFGLSIQHLPGHIPAQLLTYLAHFNSINYWAVFLALLTIATVTGLQRWLPRIPSLFVGLVAATAISVVMHLPVETIGTRFGALSASFPRPELPQLDLGTLRHLMMPAFTIALLGAIESLLSAVVADGMIGGKHRSNTELIAQGITNIVSPIFGGLPATGAIARTTVNIKSGGRTPVASLIHGLTLLVLMLFLMPLAKLIPMAVLAGILMVVAYHMSEWREFRSLLSAPISDVAILLTTFGLTVFFDLVVAIQIGMIMAAFLFMSRMSAASGLKMVDSAGDDIDSHFSRDDALSRYKIPKDVVVFEVSGAFFFGAATKFDRILNMNLHGKRKMILRMHNVFVIDATGIRVLHKVWANARRRNIAFLIVGMADECQEILFNSTYGKDFQKSQFVPTLEAAILE